MDIASCLYIFGGFMSFVAAVCPQCSSSLQLPGDVDRALCSYCGATVLLKAEVPTEEERATRLIFLGNEAKNSGNYKQAFDYFSQALVLDSKCVDAWIGKGSCAGFLSILSQDRFDEMISCHNNALNLISDPKKLIAVKNELSLEQFLLANSYFSASFDHVMKFISLLDVQHEHVERICRVIMLCENAKSLDPNQEISEFVTDIAKRGLSTRQLSDEKKQYLSSVVSKYSVGAKGGSDKKSGGGIGVYVVITILILAGLGYLQSK